MGIEITEKGTVFSGANTGDRKSNAFPGLCVLPGGRWLCAFRSAPFKTATTGQRALITWSDNQGRSWSDPIDPFEPVSVEGKPGLYRSAQPTALGGPRALCALCWVDHSNPSLAFFNDKTEGLLDTRVLLSESGDEGATWSRPNSVDTFPFKVPTPITGPILLLPNGEWVCQFELNKHYYDTTEWRHSSVLKFSRDRGKSWPEYVVTSNDPENRIYYWDQRPGVLADGTILDFFWPYDNHQAVYLNILARESSDNGRTWSKIWDTRVPGQPAPPLSFPDGRIAMAYVDRTGIPAIKLRLSEDGGKTWPDHTEVAIDRFEGQTDSLRRKSMQDAWAEQHKFAIGLPVTALLSDGDVLVVYYAGPEPDRTDIRWARLRAT